MKIAISSEEIPATADKPRLLAVRVEVGNTMKGVDLDIERLERLSEADALNAIGYGIATLGAGLKMHKELA